MMSIMQKHFMQTYMTFYEETKIVLYGHNDDKVRRQLQLLILKYQANV